MDRKSLVVLGGFLILLAIVLIGRFFLRSDSLAERPAPAKVLENTPGSPVNVSTEADQRSSDVNPASVKTTSPLKAEDQRDIPGEAKDLIIAGSAFRSRLNRLESEIEGQLRKKSPAEGLAYLQSLLSVTAPTSGSTLEDNRIRRVLAARYLNWVANRDSSLVSPIISVSKNYLRSEEDKYVRLQLVANLGGMPVKEAVTIQSVNGGPSNVVEGFIRDREEGGSPPWVRALKDAATNDSETISLLAEIASRKNDPSKAIALPVLVNMGTDESSKVVLELFKGDPSCRLSCVDKLATSKRPDTIQTFSEVLPRERDPLVISAMARGIEQSGVTPSGVGESLASALRQLPLREDGMTDNAVNSVLKAAGAVYSASKDQAALACIVQVLERPEEKTFSWALGTIARYPAAEYTPILREQLSQVQDDYKRELIGFALRKTDPTYQVPNLLWDIEELKNTLSQKKSSDKDYELLKERLSEKKSALSKLKK